MDYVAHVVPETGEMQTVLTHLRSTAEMTSEFAEVFRAGEAGYLCGLLHDIGKYSEKFQRRIRGAQERVDHSTAGALEAFQAGHVTAAFCIAGHHNYSHKYVAGFGLLFSERTFLVKILSFLLRIGLADGPWGRKCHIAQMRPGHFWAT